MQVSRSPRGDEGRLWPPGFVGGDEAARAPKRQRNATAAFAEATPSEGGGGARCGTCRPCRLERHTPCATPEVRAAAAAGHVGAGLTVEGFAALGRCVSVYWPAERAFYPGRLVAFNPLEPAFLVLYADGEWHWEALRTAVVQLLPASHRAPTAPPLPRAAQQRTQAAARRGHTGAALALLGQGAVGYVVDVPAGRNGGWLRAQVVSFEPRTHAHLLFYPADAGEEWTHLERTDVRPVEMVAPQEEAPPPAEPLGLGDDWADDALLSSLYGADAGADGAPFLIDTAPLLL
jgi:hypothetical protein